MAELKAIIYESELSFIANCVLDYEEVETGGDYFGFWDKNGFPVIQYVTGPGEKTSRSSVSFYQDIDYLHKCGNFLYNNHALQHIGSWHSHHRLELNHPSGGDVNTMRNCLDSGQEKFFITICNITRNSDVTINGFLFSKEYKNLYEHTRWAVLPGESTIRKEIDRSNSFFTKPKSRKAKYKIDQTKLNQSSPVLHYEKPELSPDSYFETDEGRKFLKREYEKIKNNQEFSNVELIQNEDKTIAITFDYDGKEIQICYPNNFSKDNPNPVIIEKVKEKEDAIQTHELDLPKEYFKRPFDLILEIKELIIRKNKDSKSKTINIKVE